MLGDRGVRHRLVLGFCFGGRTALLQGDREELDGIVVFYGRLDDVGEGGVSPLEAARRGAVRVPVLGLFGAEDPWIPGEHVAELDASLAAHGVPHDLQRYSGAGHSFFDHEGDAHAAACTDAWARVLAFVDDRAARIGSPTYDVERDIYW